MGGRDRERSNEKSSEPDLENEPHIVNRAKESVKIYQRKKKLLEFLRRFGASVGETLDHLDCTLPVSQRTAIFSISTGYRRWVCGNALR